MCLYIRLCIVTNAAGEEKEGTDHTAYLTTYAPQGAEENYILLTNNIYEYTVCQMSLYFFHLYFFVVSSFCKYLVSGQLSHHI